MLAKRNRKNRGTPAIVEAMEARRLLSIAPVPNVLGLYAGDLNFSDGTADTLTITIMSQHQRNFTGSYAEADGPVANLHGSIARNGIVHFTYHGSGVGAFSGSGSGSFDTTSTILGGTFLTRQAGEILTGSIDVQLQGSRPVSRTVPQLGSQYGGTLEYSDGATDTIEVTILKQQKRNLTGYFVQGDGQNANYRVRLI